MFIAGASRQGSLEWMDGVAAIVAVVVVVEAARTWIDLQGPPLGRIMSQRQSIRQERRQHRANKTSWIQRSLARR